MNNSAILAQNTNPGGGGSGSSGVSSITSTVDSLSSDIATIGVPVAVIAIGAAALVMAVNSIMPNGSGLGKHVGKILVILFAVMVMGLAGAGVAWFYDWGSSLA